MTSLGAAFHGLLVAVYPWLFVVGILLVLGLVFAPGQTVDALRLGIALLQRVFQGTWWLIGLLLLGLINLAIWISEQVAARRADREEARTVASWPQGGAGGSALRRPQLPGPRDQARNRQEERRS